MDLYVQDRNVCRLVYSYAFPNLPQGDCSIVTSHEQYAEQKNLDKKLMAKIVQYILEIKKKPQYITPTFGDMLDMFVELVKSLEQYFTELSGSDDEILKVSSRIFRYVIYKSKLDGKFMSYMLILIKMLKKQWRNKMCFCVELLNDNIYKGKDIGTNNDCIDGAFIESIKDAYKQLPFTYFHKCKITLGQIVFCDCGWQRFMIGGRLILCDCSCLMPQINYEMEHKCLVAG